MCVRAFSDVDECVDGSRCVNGTCSNTEGSYLCHCDAGYRLEPTNQTCQGKNLESKTISFFYHPQPTRSFLVGLLVCWLVGSAVCQILMSVLTWGRLFVGFGPVRTHRALTDVRCPAHLASPEANTASASVSAHGHQLQPWCLHISILWFWSELFVCLLWHNHLLINTVDCNYVSDQTYYSYSFHLHSSIVFVHVLYCL